MSILVQVSDIITNTLVKDLSMFLSERLGIERSEISNAIKEYLGCVPTPSPAPPKTVYKSAKKKTPPIKPAIEGSRTCTFVITRGTKGGTVCGTNIRGKGELCSKHKNRVVKK